jgi:hypothetical protein
VLDSFAMSILGVKNQDVADSGASSGRLGRFSALVSSFRSSYLYSYFYFFFYSY